jgi:hypothetical protein
MSNSYLKKPDSQFLVFATTINKVCHTNATEYGLDAKGLFNFDTLLATAKSAYEANIDEITKNVTTSMAKKAAFAELKHFLGMYIDALEGNPKVPDTDIALMGLRPRHPQGHRPLPPPQVLPGLSVRKLNDEMIFYAARPEQDQPTAGVGLPHYHGFKVRWKYDGTEDWHEIVSTRLHATLYFDHEDEGKRIIFKAAWVNPRLQEGPWTKEMNEIVG